MSAADEKGHLERLERAVEAAGIRQTPQRREIYRQLVRTADHPDAETVFRAVKRRMPTVSLDTVYRTLWMLRDLGLVKTLGPTADAARFDFNLRRHHHYVCVGCGLIRDFESEELNELRVPPGVEHFGSVLDSQVEVRGLCASCQGGGRETTPSTKKSLRKPKERRHA